MSSPSLSWDAPPADEFAVRALSQACAEIDGCRNLDDGLLWAYLDGRGEGLWDPSGRAFLSLGTEGEEGRLQLLVHPAARGQGLGTHLLGRGLERLRQKGCRAATIWTYGDRTRSVAWLERKGFASLRVLFELRRSDGAVEARPEWPAGWAIRSFGANLDENAWHTLHRQLQSHPARAWTMATLRRQLADPATPPESFWLLWQGKALRGYVWLKHSEPEEIFLFALDPEVRGQGLGRALLAWALSRGNGQAFVFCDDQRRAALELYRSFGFQEVGRDRCLRARL